jgi:hypothetical protein
MTLAEPIQQKTAWHPDELAILQKSIAEGRSYGQIAAQLGRSRCAVGGMATRIKANGGEIIPRKKPAPAPVKSSPTPIGAPQQIFGEDEGLTITDLAPHQCRFSIGAREDGVWVFCGERTRKLGDALCNHHHKLSYVPVQRRR